MTDLPTTPGPIVPPPFGYLSARVLDDGRLLCLMPLYGGRARLVVGRGWVSYDVGW